MAAIASQITSLAIVYSTDYSDVDQRKHQSSASLAFVWGIHRGPVNFPHKWPVTRKMFPFDDVMMHQYWMKAWISEKYIRVIICDFVVTGERYRTFWASDTCWETSPRGTKCRWWRHDKETLSVLLAISGLKPKVDQNGLALFKFNNMADLMIWCFLWSMPEQTCWVKSWDPGD